MSWYDAFLIVVIALVVKHGAKQGFGKSLLESVALLVAVRLDYAALGWLARTVKLSGDPLSNKALVFAFTFLLLGAGLMYLAKIISDVAPLSGDVFDPILGGVFGIATGIILCHVMTQIIIMPAPSGRPNAIRDSVLAREVVEFRTYRYVMEHMYSFEWTRQQKIE